MKRMKKIVKAAISLSLFFITNTFAQWEMMSGEGSVAGVWFDFINDSVGWSAGGSSFQKTTDGGQTWHSVLAPTEIPAERKLNFVGIDFVNDSWTLLPRQICLESELP